MLNRQEKTGEGGQAPHTERMKIYLAELGEKADSSVQGGTRPVIVLQNNAGNRSSPTVIVAPITSKLEKPHLPTHVVLGQSNLPKQSMVLLEQVMTIDQKLRLQADGEIGEHDGKSVERALKVSFGLLHSRKKERRNISYRAMISSVCNWSLPDDQVSERCPPKQSPNRESTAENMRCRKN